MKKLITVLFMFLLTFIISVSVSPVNAQTGLVDFKLSNGTQVYLDRAGQIKAQIPTEYNVKEREFRAVWISQLVGDVPSITSKEAYISNMMSVLDVLERYNINAIVYHIRIMNDALYDSDDNPKSAYLGNVDFEEWDYLEWLIDEVHRRGIEFHAWMNPYRIQNGLNNVSSIPARYANFPNNPASDASMLLVGDNGVILNPGEPRVRQFIVDTSMDVIEKYDVDAIHFDDYFYISMNQNADAHTYSKYKANSQTTNIEDWRREQVDIFIKDLSDEMREYNTLNNRQVQLGISPSGIWRNGNGVVSGYNENGDAITNGSDTVGFAHYGNYLYSDTKKWIDNEWIDYVVPQAYWAFTKQVALHAGIVNWWQQVVKNKDVNLYIGMGLYMISGGDTEWNKDPYEASNQALYSSQFENVDGMVMYQYKSIITSAKNPGLQRIKDSYWNRPALAPEVKTLAAVTPEKVESVNIVKSSTGFVLDWMPANNARKYAIYRNDGIVDINDPMQLVGVVGYNNSVNKVLFQDIADVTKTYNYAVVSVSGTNTKGLPLLKSTTDDESISYDAFEMSDIYLEGPLQIGKDYQVKWMDAEVIAGSKVEYVLQYSTDLVTWNEVTEGRLRITGGSATMYSHYLKYEHTKTPIYYRVVASNDLDSIVTNVIMLEPQNLSDYFGLVSQLINEKIFNIINGK